MTNEDRIRALEKIAQSGEGHKAFLEGQAKAHGDYAKSRTESADSLSGWGNIVGVGGGAAGGAMTLKGVKQMLDKGVPYDRRVWKVYRDGPPRSFYVDSPSPTDRFYPYKYKEVTGPIRTMNGKVAPAFTMQRMGTVTTRGILSPEYGGPIVPRAKVPPRIQGKKLALKGGLLGLGSLGLSAVLHGMAGSNREKANEHTKSLHEISSTLKVL